jgi:hypothetical protein
MIDLMTGRIILSDEIIINKATDSRVLENDGFKFEKKILLN